MTNIKNKPIRKVAWLLRPLPHKNKRLDEFKKESIIAIGWPKTGDLSGKKKDEIKIILSKGEYKYESLKLGNVVSNLDIFVNKMEIGDLILIPDGDNIYFARITGEYYFDETKANDEEGYPHQRKIEWSANEISREDLSMKLRSSLKVHRTTSDLSKHFDEIEALSKGEKILLDEELEVNGSKTSLPTNVIEVKYPLRPGFEISFVLPKDLSKKESERLSLYFSTLYFEE